MGSDSRKNPAGSRFQGMLRKGVESARHLMHATRLGGAALPPSDTGAPKAAEEQALATSADDQVHLAWKTIAAVATAVWRLKNKVDAVTQAALPPELRNIPRHVQAAWDALATGKVQVDDPTGRRYVPGMAVNVLTVQPLEGITCEVVHETIKPSVYFNDALIQRADVILGTPVAESEQLRTGTEPLQERASDDTDIPCMKGTTPDGANND